MTFFILFALPIKIIECGNKGIELKLNTGQMITKDKNFNPVILLAVPQKGDVKVRVKFKNFLEITEKSLSIGVPGITEGKYSTEKYLPPSEFKFSKTIEWWRDIRVLRISLTPLKKINNSIVQIAREVDIKVEFTHPFEEVKKKSAFEEAYKQILINYEQAKNWKKRNLFHLFTIKSSPFEFSNKWVKITVDSTGVYRIYGKDLKKAGVEISKINPLTLELYGSVEYTPIKNIPDKLTEIPIYVHGEEDGKFDEKDYILFYAKGADHWEWEDTTYTINPYTKYDVYWLTWGVKHGERIQVEKESPSLEGKEYALSPVHFEKEIDCPGRAGVLWIWEELRKETRESSTSKTFYFEIYDSKIKRIRGRLFAITSNTPVKILLNNTLIAEIENMPKSGAEVIPWIFDVSTDTLNIRNTFTIDVVTWGELKENIVYIDWFDLFVERKISVKHSPFFIFAEEGEKYTLTDMEAPCLLLDVSVWYKPLIISGWISSNVFGFKSSKNRIIYITSERKFRKPISIEVKNPKKLHKMSWDIDCIIVVPDAYYYLALGYAEYRKKQGISVKVVKLSDIFDEFGNGFEDPLAIKKFLEYVYISGNYRPLYAVFIGDGTYDYKNNRNEERPPYFPIYTEGETLDPSVLHICGATYDSWFVDFDGTGYTPEMTFGRIPVRSLQGLQKYFEKVKTFENFTPSDWLNRVIFLGDDFIKGNPDSLDPIRDHIINCELADSMLYPLFVAEKIYLINYNIAQGEKRKATQDLLKALSKGALFWIFFGHGNGYLLTHEHVFKTEDVGDIHNGKRYFIGFFGTCGAGRFEDTYKECIAEELIRAQEAAVATIAATKGTSSEANRRFLLSLLSVYLSNPSTALGLCFITGIPYEKMEILFGDPLLKLPPFYGKKISSPAVLQRGIKYSINIPSPGDEYLFQIFGSSKKIHYEEFIGDTLLQVDYILRGTQGIKLNGYSPEDSLLLSFTIPVDLDTGNYGLLHAMFRKKDSLIVVYKDSLYIKENTDYSDDEKGPEFVSLKINGRPVQNDMYVSKNIEIEGVLKDSNGISITGTPGKAGHSFSMVINSGEIIYLSSKFSFYPNTDTIGSFKVKIELPAEKDTIHIWALDNLLNESYKKVIVNLKPEEKLTVKNLVVFPTPAKDHLSFIFYINKPAKVKIKIFTIKARPVITLSRMCNAGFVKINWNLKDKKNDEIANGVYIFKLIAESSESQRKETVIKKGSFIVIH